MDGEDDGVSTKSETETETKPNGVKNETTECNGESSIFEAKKVGVNNFQCCNPACIKTTNLDKSPIFALSFYDIPKKKKKQYICGECFEDVVKHYEEMSSLLKSNQMLHTAFTPRAKELVEIVDSSDEESDETMDVEAALPQGVVSLVRTELESTIERVLKNFNIQQQLTRSTNLLTERIDRTEAECKEFEKNLNFVRFGLNDMHRSFYSVAKQKIRQEKEIEIADDFSNTILATTGITSNTKFITAMNGVLQKPAVKINEIYFAIRGVSLLSCWDECKILEEVATMVFPSKYKIKFLQGNNPSVTVDGKRLAYRMPPTARLQQGTRIIAAIDKIETTTSAFYAGVIAETLSAYNKNRYLVIFDNGYTLYAHPWNIRVVCEQSVRVWEDVDPHSQVFVRDYLNNYKTVRPMVQVKKGQRLLTEKDGRWHLATVSRIDSSLVLLYFPELKRTEWIFRGSKRLAPLFRSDKKRERQQISKFQKRNIPSIEYITIDDDDDDDKKDTPGTSGISAAGPSSVASRSSPNHEADSPPDSKEGILRLHDAPVSRVVAKKSTAPGTKAPISMNKNIIYCDSGELPQGKTNLYTTKNYRGPNKYTPHQCNPDCIFKISFDLKTYNLLARPLVSGWERQICKASSKRAPTVVYRAPCGRRLRYMYELHRYLRITRAPLNVENFDFDPEIRALATFVALNLLFEMKDLSHGKELMPVSCVNFHDDTKPPPCEYSTERIPTEGVNLNLDDNFLCGCDCEDDCFDKQKCQCWQLTIQGALFNNPNQPVDDIGYVYKRLDELVLTGIYECNSRCKCKVNECLNRVVQHPLQTKLQVFKTDTRGWGIRCVNDIPKGSFICIYAGHLLTEEVSNMICAQNEDKAGDEYFADLDYIETVEQIKEGYESEAFDPEDDEDCEENEESGNERQSEALNSNQDSDDEFTIKIRPSGRAVNTRSQLRQNRSNDDLSRNGNRLGEERERVNLIPNSLMDTVDTPDASNSRKSFRQLFGMDEQPYVMDAKKSGNLGRYFNHSCVPNLFVQNVFVDTHDLRFPWVAFFSSRNIMAGSELTWNYSYDVGSVPGKALYCHCGEVECRKRLL